MVLTMGTTLDHAGEKPGEAAEELAKAEIIDALVLIVDLAPAYEVVRSTEGQRTVKKLSIAEIAGAFQADAGSALERRRQDQEQYLAPSTVHILLTFAIKRGLRKVILVINKVDVLRELQKDGLIDMPDEKQYATTLYAQLISTLESALKNKGVDFSVHVVSALQDSLRNLEEDMFCGLPEGLR